MNDQQHPELERIHISITDIPLPEGLRSSNRMAMARALAQKPKVYWWQRRISLSLPMAAAVLVCLGLQSVLLFYALIGPDRSVAMDIPHADESVSKAVEASPQFETQYSQSHVYLAGFGFIYQSEAYTLEEI